MKRKLSILLVLSLILALLTCNPVMAGSAGLTTREKAIANAYVKTLETGNLKYLNQYKYPGLTYGNPTYSDMYQVKILGPKVSKSYVKSKKLYCLYISGILVISTKDNVGLVNMRVGIFIKKKGSTTYAYLEKTDGTDVYADEVIAIDDLSDSNLTKLEDYLTDQYGADTASALMYPDSGYEDLYDEEYDIEEPKQDTMGDSSAATLKSPVEKGDVYTWSGQRDYLGDSLSAAYSLSVEKVESLSFDEIEDLGISRPTDTSIAYKMVTLKYSVDNAKLKHISGDAYLYGSSLMPFYGGVYTDTGNYTFGIIDYGFEGSLCSVLMDKVKTKITENPSSFTVEGKAIVPFIAGEKNYLVVTNEFEEDYEKAKLYFRIN